MPTIRTTLWHDTCIVGLRIAPHVTKALSVDDQKEPNGATVVTNVQGAWHAEDHLAPFPLFHVIVTPNVLLAARIFPVVWIKSLDPTERFAKAGKISYVFRVLTIQREKSVVRASTAVANPRYEESVLGGQLHSKACFVIGQSALRKRRPQAISVGI